jgi:hypothetical protein
MLTDAEADRNETAYRLACRGVKRNVTPAAFGSVNTPEATSLGGYRRRRDAEVYSSRVLGG